jgi:broad specificity phosphatase PhoE
MADSGARLPAGDTPRGNRTPATGVKGPRADRYTMGAGDSESTRLDGVLLARHGETDYNAEGRFQGLGPVPLNARGREQAQALAEAAASRGFVELWCSPLVRARETADIVGGRIGLVPREDVRLVETDTGDWTDRSFASVMAEDPDGFAAFERADPDFAYPGGESLRHQTARVLEALGEIARRPQKPVLVVFHAMAIRLALTARGHPTASVPHAALVEFPGAASSSGRAPDF